MHLPSVSVCTELHTTVNSQTGEIEQQKVLLTAIKS